MATILIAFSTREGHTAVIADHMRGTLEARGHAVRLQRLDEDPAAIAGDVDGVLVGGPLHAHSYAHELRDWICANRLRLDRLPSALFTVCLAAADDTDESRAAIREIEDRFAEDTGWFPAQHTVIAGCLAWSHYDVFTRTLMRLMLRDQPTADLDRSHDHDYTDYDAVSRFAEELAAAVEAAARAAAV